MIQGPGDLAIPDGSRVFLSDGAEESRDEEYEEDAPDGTPIHEEISDWAELIDILDDLPDGSITGDLIINGHGANGGVQASGSNIDGQNITQEQADVIDAKLAAGARIIIASCTQADAEDNDHMQRLADMTDHPVVGNHGNTRGNDGDGDWYRFDPE